MQEICHALIRTGRYKLEKVLMNLSNGVQFLCLFFSSQWWTLSELHTGTLI